jgi:osmotically-inducible protein OsmY
MARTSEDIKKDIIDNLYWDARVDASDINVDVQSGDVTLLGTVPSFLAQQAALEDTRSVKGVAGIDSRIEVRRLQTVPAAADTADHIRDLYLWDPALADQNVLVSADAGVVTLEGTVDAAWKKLRAETKALGVTGVHSVTNDLAVVPTMSVLDETIADDVLDALRRSSNVDETEISVTVENGTVTLTGTVPTWIARNAAFDAALYTDGVVDVVDNLVIESLY